MCVCVCGRRSSSSHPIETESMPLSQICRYQESKVVVCYQAKIYVGATVIKLAHLKEGPGVRTKLYNDLV